MRLNDIINHAQSFFEKIGYLRLSSFYSPTDPRGELVQKIARIVTKVFVLLSLIDSVLHFLPSRVRLIIDVSLISLISSLGISLLLKGIQSFLCSEDDADEEFKTPKKSFVFGVRDNHFKEFDSSSDTFSPSPTSESFSGGKTDKEKQVSSARRSLLPDFNRVARK